MFAERFGSGGSAMRSIDVHSVVGSENTPTYPHFLTVMLDEVAKVLERIDRSHQFARDGFYILPGSDFGLSSEPTREIVAQPAIILRCGPSEESTIRRE